MSKNHSTRIMERVRHPFRARHVQLLAREEISPGFIRLTLGSEEMAEFTSVGFDDHVKLLLPQEGQEKPHLPEMRDGRPHFDGERPLMRDYTPINYCPEQKTVQLDFALHAGGPALDWALHAPIGQWAGLAGPRGSMVLPADLPWYVLFGDETAIPAIERFLQTFQTSAQIIVRVQVKNPADQRAWASHSKHDIAYVQSLEQAAKELSLPVGAGFCWGACEYQQTAALRKILAAKGVASTHMYVSAYWRQGVADYQR